MKKLIVLTIILLGGFTSQNMDAQVSVKVNITSQPIWGPVGYDYVEYYYIPDIEVYYNVPKRKFFYFEGGRWISRSSLPPRYYNFDLYRVDKVVINEPSPYFRHDTYKVRYAPHYGRRNQVIIRDCREERYFEIKDHPEHYRWKEIKRRQKMERKERRYREHHPDRR